jgi:hypothetical protein
MQQRFPTLKLYLHDPKLAHFIHPFREFFERRVRLRVFELIAVMASEIALVRHVELTEPRMIVEKSFQFRPGPHSIPSFLLERLYIMTMSVHS